MSIHLMNADRLVGEVLAEVWAPPPPVDYLAFAEDTIVFSKRESSFPGPYNRGLFPEFDEIFRALRPADPCRTVTVAKSAQLGGTVIANVFTLGSMALDPGDFLYVHPTQDNAKRWSNLKLKPMLRGTTALTRLFPEKSRDGGDSIFYKERIDGRGAIQISGANSPASLSMVSMQRQVQDDLAKWETDEKAGDPEALADSRSQAFEFAKILKISTPLVWPGCRITKNYRAGSQERPYVPCPQCGHMQVLEWEALRRVIEEMDEPDPDRAHFICTAPDCGGVIEEHHLPAMKRRLEWRAENPAAKPTHRSFWIWGAYSVLQSWPRIARRWLEVRGDPASEQTFLNDVCGLAYEAMGEAVPWETLRDRAAESPYVRGTVPAGALLITIGVDCQGDRVEWHVVGWGRDFRRWTIEYGVFPGHISDAGCQTLLDGLLQQTWPNAVRRQVGADLLAIDGNAWTEDVWGWARKHPASRVIMVRGVGSDTAPLLARVSGRDRKKDGKPRKYSRRFFHFAASVLKMGLYRNLAKTDPLERGFVGLPRGLEDEFFRQLTAERRKPTKKRDGFVRYAWVKEATQANEGLDTMNQAEAAAIRLGVRSLPDARWAALEAERESPPDDVQPDLEDLMTMPASVEPAQLSEAPKVRRGRAERMAEMARRLNGG